jgi:hypothetical protein
MEEQRELKARVDEVDAILLDTGTTSGSLCSITQSLSLSLFWVFPPGEDDVAELEQELARLTVDDAADLVDSFMLIALFFMLTCAQQKLPSPPAATMLPGNSLCALFETWAFTLLPLQSSTSKQALPPRG